MREAERIAQIHAEAGRRRDEQRQAAAAAVARMHERGEKIDAIAALAETTESEVRGYLKLGGCVAFPGPTPYLSVGRLHPDPKLSGQWA